MADNVSHDGVSFKLKEQQLHFAPERGISINGEAGDGIRPPYWVILSFRRGTDGQVICSDGYAHAMFSRGCPVPVDSGLERKTIKSLVKLAEWVSKKSSPPALTLEKPLFDFEVNVEGEKGFVLPDLILRINFDDAVFTAVIETMGYTDEE